jgi:hypothetical protein
MPLSIVELVVDTQAKQLAAAYNIPDISESREKNLNKFMAFVGGEQLHGPPLSEQITERSLSNVPNGPDGQGLMVALTEWRPQFRELHIGLMGGRQHTIRTCL